MVPLIASPRRRGACPGASVGDPPSGPGSKRLPVRARGLVRGSAGPLRRPAARRAGVSEDGDGPSGSSSSYRSRDSKNQLRVLGHAPRRHAPGKRLNAERSSRSLGRPASMSVAGSTDLLKRPDYAVRRRARAPAATLRGSEDSDALALKASPPTSLTHQLQDNDFFRVHLSPVAQFNFSRPIHAPL